MRFRSLLEVLEYQVHDRSHQVAYRFLASGEDITDALSYGELNRLSPQIAALHSSFPIRPTTKN